MEESNLVQEVFSELKSEIPQIDHVKSLLESNYELDRSEASSVLKNVILDINKSMFIPITKMELILVEGCNLACTYCFESQFLNTQHLRRRLMDNEVIHQAINLLFDYSFGQKELEVTLFGGEPTLNMPGIRETVTYANKLAKAQGKTIKYDTTSNGVLFTPEMVQYFADSEIMVLLSIDGTREAHDKYRLNKKGMGTFDSVLRGMDLLKKVQPWIGTKMTIMPDVANTLFESIRYLYERGVNQFVIGHATGENWTPEYLAEYASQMEQAKEWYRSVKSNNDITISQFDDAESGSCGGFFGCGAGRNTIAVEASGKITGCSRISTVEDHTETGILGDVEHGLYALNTRQEMTGCSSLYKNCSDEGIEKEYRGGCFATNFEANGDMFKPNITEHEISLKINTNNG